MIRWPSLALAATVLGCSNLAEVDGIAGLEIIIPRNASVEVGQTIQLQARAFDRSGQTVSAPVTWVALDNTVTLTSDGMLTGVTGGTTARVQAQAGSIVSDLVTFTVLVRPDTLAISGDSMVTVAAGAASSPPLVAGLFSRQAGALQGVAGRTITYTVTDPTFADPAQRTVELNGGVLTLAATTAGDGFPSPAVTLSRVAGQTAPAAAIVTVTATTAAGTPVPGSGQRFIVTFQ